MIKNYDKKILSWAFYDWANSAYATTVMAGFFPLFFKQYWGADLAAAQSTLYLGYANSLASVFIVIFAPVIGAIADQGSSKKKFLFYFTMMGIVMTGGLSFLEMGGWQMAVFIYVMATIGFMGGNVFYDALLLDIAKKKQRDLVSALGYSFGYLGGGLLFSINVAMTLWPEFFGLSDKTIAVRLSFFSVALWWALFSIPVFLFVKEKHCSEKRHSLQIIRAGICQYIETFKAIRQLRVVILFLCAYWFYIDGVDTVIRMAVDYGLSLGFDSNSLIVALLLTQFVGFPAALVFGIIGQKYGAKTGIFIGIGVYILVILWAYQMQQVWEFYLLAIVVGLVQGGIQALSRSLYSRLIPEDKATEFFGFYNMLGKFAAVIGPILMGWVGILTGNPRFAMLSIVILFLVGGLLLFAVDEKKAAISVQ